MTAGYELTGFVEELVDAEGTGCRVVHVGGEAGLKFLEEFVVDVEVFAWGGKGEWVFRMDK